MKKNFTFLCMLAMLSLFSIPTLASSAEVPSTSETQQRGVSGIVKDTDGAPVIGATVIISSTGLGSITDHEGAFTLSNVKPGEVVEISSLGYKTTSFTVVGSQSQYTVEMAVDGLLTDEVVVTALGLTKAKKALGYSVQEVGSDDLNKAPVTEIGSALAGKVAGLQINTSSTLGGSSRLVLRGETGLNLSGNEAMIVVDGVPITGSGSVSSSVDYGNALGDISPNDIESISVLKGGTAAALYGSRAGNGVILITTKSGQKGKLKVDFSSSVMFESLLAYPNRYQYKYSAGRQDNVTNMPFNEDGSVNLNMYDGSWSTLEYDENVNIEWWYSPTTNGYRAADTEIQNKGSVIPTPFVSTGKNNYEEFFETGYTVTNSVSISGGNDVAFGRVSYENMKQTGMQPGTDQTRNTLSTNFTLNLSDKFKVNAAINYSDTDSDNRPSKEWSSSSIYYVMSWMPPGMNFDEMKNYWQPGLEGLATVNYKSAYSNPYFISYEIQNGYWKEHIYGNISATYTPTENISLMFRHGEDLTYDRTRGGQTSYDNSGRNLYWNTSSSNVREKNTDFLATYNNKFGGSDQFSYSLNVGASMSGYDSYSSYINASNLLVPGLATADNNATTKDTGEYMYATETRSVYGFADIDYRNMIYLSVTGRNDWDSTLPVDNRSYFYPSASLSILMHEMVNLPSAISFLKLRGSVAQVGSGTSAYSLVSTVSNSGSYDGFTVFSTGGIANPDLKPQMSLTSEVGLTARFFNNRAGIDMSLYSTSTKNQIMGISLPISSGYSSRTANVGEIRNRGLEIVADVTPIATKNVNWSVTANFSTNDSEVVSLTDDIDRYELASFGDNGETVMAVVGGPVMGIYGYTQKTVTDESSEYYGEPIYDSDGAPVRNTELEYLGKANPDWTLGLSTNLTYKNYGFSAVVDIRHGGICYSGATNIMVGSGCDYMTEDWRTNGVGGEGVIEDGNGGYVENNIILSGADIKNTWVSPWRKVSTNNFFDASYVKIRELTFSYTFPERWLENIPISNVRFSLVGRNLFVWDRVPNQDPDVYRDGIPGYSGVWTYPTSRTYGFSLNVSF